MEELKAYLESKGLVVETEVPEEYKQVEPVKIPTSRQERRLYGRLQENEARRTFAQMRRDAIIHMNKTQREMKKTWNIISERDKQAKRARKNEHRTGHKGASATVDDVSSDTIVVSESGH